jgi:rhodanese-related sulfurtransferase
MDGEITPDELAALRDGGDGAAPLVVDIRAREAYARGHIPGSEHVPFQRLPTSVDDVTDADHVVTVCPHGKASIKAARLIAAYEDFDGTVESLAGGLDAWDGPLTATDGGGSRASDAGDGGSEAPF